MEEITACPTCGSISECTGRGSIIGVSVYSCTKCGYNFEHNDDRCDGCGEPVEFCLCESVVG